MSSSSICMQSQAMTRSQRGWAMPRRNEKSPLPRRQGPEHAIQQHILSSLLITKSRLLNPNSTFREVSGESQRLLNEWDHASFSSRLGIALWEFARLAALSLFLLLPSPINRKGRLKAQAIEKYPVDKLTDMSHRIMVFLNISYKNFLKAEFIHQLNLRTGKEIQSTSF